MRAKKSVGLFLLLLFGFLLLGYLGDRLEESRRQLFDLWLMALIMMMAVFGGGFLYSRRGQKNHSDMKLKQADSTGQSSHGHFQVSKAPVAMILVGTLICLIGIWVLLIYLGLVPNRQGAAFAQLQMVSAMTTAGAAILLSLWAPTVAQSQAVRLRLAAIALLVPAALGIFLVPLIAVRVWHGYVDFEKYVRQVAGAWIYLTVLGVVICIWRTRRGS